jgi:hypothetical protein
MTEKMIALKILFIAVPFFPPAGITGPIVSRFAPRLMTDENSTPVALQLDHRQLASSEGTGFSPYISQPKSTGL